MCGFYDSIRANKTNESPNIFSLKTSPENTMKTMFNKININCRIYNLMPRQKSQNHLLNDNSLLFSYFFWEFDKHFCVQENKICDVELNGSEKYSNLVPLCLEKCHMSHKCNHRTKGTLGMFKFHQVL